METEGHLVWLTLKPVWVSAMGQAVSGVPVGHCLALLWNRRTFCWNVGLKGYVCWVMILISLHTFLPLSLKYLKHHFQFSRVVLQVLSAVLCNFENITTVSLPC
jgi:hypothetical protein